MKGLMLFILLLLVSFSLAQTVEELMYGEMFGVLSYLGLLLLSFLFTMIVAIPFISEVSSKTRIELTSLLSNHAVWAAETALGLMMVFLTIPLLSPQQISRANLLFYTIAAICALLPFAIFVTIAFISNIYKRNILKNIFSMVIWGIFASSVALLLNQSIGSWLSFTSSSVVLFLIISAFLEEAIKGLGLAESLKSQKAVPVFSMLYGFSVGVGFSMIENWLYFSYVTTPLLVGVSNWTQVLFYRSFFTTLAHGFFTATNAYFICRMQKSSLRFLSGLAIAFALHLIYNLLTESDFALAGPFFVLAMAFGFLYINYSNMKNTQK